MAIHSETAERGIYPYSYVEKYWDHMYLGERFSTPVNSNPFYIMQRDKLFSSPLTRAASFINFSTKFWLKVVDGELEADIDPSTGKPLCMYQFSNMFGTGRIPGPNVDTHEFNSYSEHIVVAYLGRYFPVQVISEGKPIDVQSIERALLRIKDIAGTHGEERHDVGLITSQERNFVYKARKELEDFSDLNAKSFRVIDKSLFVVTLDDNTSSDINTLSKIGLTGLAGCSRWFDKHNMVVDANGEILFNFEHAAGDGMTWNRWLTEAWYNMNNLIDDKYPYEKFKSNDVKFDVDKNISQLEWKFSNQSINHISQAKQNFSQVIENIDYSVLEYNEYGKAQAKQWKVSPDALAQMVMQLGYHKATSFGDISSLKGVPVYEACAMKSYFHGRTETIRSCSKESTDMSKMYLSDSNAEERQKAFKEACKIHVEIAKGAKSCSGEYMGVDRHLFALKNLAKEQSLALEDIPFFNDPVYVKSSTWTLSTSNVTSDIIKLFGFGPTSSQGFGLGYQTFSNSLPFCIISFKDSQPCSSKDYGKGVTDALTMVRNSFR